MSAAIRLAGRGISRIPTNIRFCNAYTPNGRTLYAMIPPGANVTGVGFSHIHGANAVLAWLDLCWSSPKSNRRMRAICELQTNFSTRYGRDSATGIRGKSALLKSYVVFQRCFIPQRRFGLDRVFAFARAAQPLGVPRGMCANSDYHLHILSGYA